LHEGEEFIRPTPRFEAQPVGEVGIHRSPYLNFPELQDNGRGVSARTDALQGNLNLRADNAN